MSELAYFLTDEQRRRRAHPPAITLRYTDRVVCKRIRMWRSGPRGKCGATERVLPPVLKEVPNGTVFVQVQLLTLPSVGDLHPTVAFGVAKSLEASAGGLVLLRCDIVP